MKLLRTVSAGAAVAALLSLSACAGAGKPDLVPQDASGDIAVTVQVLDNRYEPARVEIEPGQAVRWEFLGNMEHDVVADDGSFVSELVVTGEYVFTFNESGEWEYDCSIHPEMRGVVVVRSE